MSPIEEQVYEPVVPASNGAINSPLLEKVEAVEEYQQEGVDESEWDDSIPQTAVTAIALYDYQAGKFYTLMIVLTKRVNFKLSKFYIRKFIGVAC